MTESSPKHSHWRETYKVHPAADVFPMMSDEELRLLGEDIKKSRFLRQPIVLQNTADTTKENILLDGRNRLEAIERAGLKTYIDKHYYSGDPVAHIISLNIHRRHLTKQQQAELIVAAYKASPQLEEVPKKRHVKGKPGSEKDDLKAAIVADAAKRGISESTVERAMAKAELTPEEIEARRQKYLEQARNRDERARERREEKVQRAGQRKSDVAEALAILEPLGLETASRLVALLMDSGTVCDVSVALVDRESERDKARSDLDELLQEEAEAAAGTEP